MKKKLIICLAVLAAFTACEKSAEETTTAVTTETTPLTLTEEITETAPSPEPPKAIKLAVYNPFADAAKVESSVQKELAEAAEKIADARAFLYAEPTMLYSKSKYSPSYSGEENPNVYADTENPLEENTLEEYTYCPLNTDIAKTEEELTKYLRSCFTEDFISDEEMQKTLFEPEKGETIPAEYKTVDGVLCMRQQYLGVAPEMHFDDVNIISYDGETAEIAVFGTGVSEPPYMFFVKLSYTDEYGWRADNLDCELYYPDRATLLYNAVTLREETLNRILGGGNVPENAKTIEIEGEAYTQTDLDMTIAEMDEFFGEMFKGEYFVKQYVLNVYTEADGVLYRKNSAPRWYLPEMEINPFGMDLENHKVEFYDSVTDERFSKVVNLDYYCEYMDGEQEYYYIRVDSVLPIKELE